MADKKPNTVQVARSLIEPVMKEYGLDLWDVRFEKEGGRWYLRYLIDRLAEGEALTIEDCENVSRRIDKLLDAADPIEQSYTLEVGSPGIERELTQDWHFDLYLGYDVTVRLIRPVEGNRDFTGTLRGKNGKQVTIALEDGTELSVSTAEAAYIKLYCDFDD